MDRTKVLHGPRTQTYGETNYLMKISKVLDRTKVLHGHRTQTYGKVNHLRRILNCSVLQDDYILKVGLSPRQNEGPDLFSDPQI